jgi:hypothetical protein
MRQYVKVENRLFQGEFNEEKTLQQRTQSQGCFGRSQRESQKEIEGERDRLYQQIGKLQVEVELRDVMDPS